MPAWVLPAITTAASGLMNMFTSKGDKYSMSPEQSALYKMLLAKYKSNQFGFSPQEKHGMRFGLKNRLQDYATGANASASASAGRRGEGWSPQATTEIIGRAGQDYSKGLVNIDVASEEAGRQEKANLEQLLAQLSQGNFQPGTDNSDMFGGLAENISLLDYLKKMNMNPASPMPLFIGSQGGW